MKIKISDIVRHVLLAFLAVVWLVPIVWLLATSFSKYTGITFIIACFTCIISTAFVLMVAYATSCMRFRGRKTLMNIAVIINLFPGVLAMIAVYFILKSIGLTNSHLGLIFVYSASSGLGYLIAKGERGKGVLESGHADEQADHRIYGHQFFPRTVDGFRLCEDDAQFRCRIPVDGGDRTL